MQSLPKESYVVPFWGLSWHVVRDFTTLPNKELTQEPAEDFWSVTLKGPGSSVVCTWALENS